MIRVRLKDGVSRLSVYLCAAAIAPQPRKTLPYAWRPVAPTLSLESAFPPGPGTRQKFGLLLQLIYVGQGFYPFVF